MMRKPLGRIFPGVPTDSTLSCVISFYPCLNPGGISEQPDDDENLERLTLKPDFESPRESMRLTSQDDPAISPDDLIKCKTGFIMFKFLDWIAPREQSSVQIQILLDDLPFPSFSYTVAQIGDSQMNRMGNCFIRDLSHSEITFRMKKGGGQFDEIGRVLASRTENTLDLLKQCLVCVHAPL